MSAARAPRSGQHPPLSSQQLRAAVAGDEPIGWFTAAFHLAAAAGQVALRDAPRSAERWKAADNGYSRPTADAWVEQAPVSPILPGRLDLDRAGGLLQLWFSVGEDDWRQTIAFAPVSVWDLWQTAVQFGWLAAFEQGAVTGGCDPVPEDIWWPH